MVTVPMPLARDHEFLKPLWQFRYLLRAPHRVAFFMGAVMLGASALWWAGVLLVRALQWPWNPVVPASLMHALVFGLSYMPLFFCGFLYTAGPKWLKQPAVSARSLLPALALLMTGWIVTWIGMHWQSHVAALGMALVALGWAALCLRFVRMVWRSRVQDRMHMALVSAACLMGLGVMVALAVALALHLTLLLRTCIQLGIWWFMAPVFAVVSHRMIPFFNANLIPFLDAWRPNWLLTVILGVLLLEGVSSTVDLWWHPLPQVMRWLQASLEAPLALLMLGLAVRWGFIQNLKIRLLAMLHGGFVWFGLSLGLNAASHALMASTGETVSLGLAPMHAMTMGYLGCTMFSMVTRVASGHGGRKESADNAVWWLYWALQAAVALRVVAAVVQGYAQALVLTAVAAWCVAMLCWALRYGYWFGTPRPDGRDG